MIYLSFLADLAINAVAVFLLAYVIYYRRHRRRDLLLAYVALNIGLFVVVAMLTLTPVGLGLGFGLFAILSIIRLRSDAITQEEVAYYFMTLVLGLVNGLRLDNEWLVVMVNSAILLTMYVTDNRRLLSRTQRVLITLDVIVEDPAGLVAELERRVGGRVVHHVVNEVDYVRDVTVVDVRYIARWSPPAISPRPSTPRPFALARQGGGR